MRAGRKIIAAMGIVSLITLITIPSLLGSSSKKIEDEKQKEDKVLQEQQADESFRIDRKNFLEYFTLHGTLGHFYTSPNSFVNQAGHPFNHSEHGLSLEPTPRYSEETGIVTLTPNRHDWTGSFTLKDRISMEKPFNLKGAVYLGDRTDTGGKDWGNQYQIHETGKPVHAYPHFPGGADGIGFAFHPQMVGATGFTGGNLGIGGLAGATGYKFDTFWNSYQQMSDDAYDANHLLGWETDIAEGRNNPFGTFVEAGTDIREANSPFSPVTGFVKRIADSTILLNRDKILGGANAGVREEINHDKTGDPENSNSRYTEADYGYDKHADTDEITGFMDVLYKYEPNPAGDGGTLSVYAPKDYARKASGAGDSSHDPTDTVTTSFAGREMVLERIGRHQIDSSESLALSVTASTGSFRNLQQFRFDYFEFTGVKRLTIDKVWEDSNDSSGFRPDWIDVMIRRFVYKDGVKTEIAPYQDGETRLYSQGENQNVTLSEDKNTWTWVKDDLPKYISLSGFGTEPLEVYYEVEEKFVPGYQSLVKETTSENVNDDGRGDRIFEIKNKIANPTSFTGRKIWSDDLDQSNRQDLTIGLYRQAAGNDAEAVYYKDLAEEAEVDGQTQSREEAYPELQGKESNDPIWQEQVVRKLNLAEAKEHQWTYDFTHLPAESEPSKLYSYSVQEHTVLQGYEAPELVGNNIVNTLRTTSLSIEKKWDDEDYSNRPSKVGLYLVRREVGETEWHKVANSEIELEAPWQHTFENLPTHANGKALEYEVREEEIPGYHPLYGAVTGELDQGLDQVLTNRLNINIDVEKLWKDSAGQPLAAKEKSEVEVQLRRVSDNHVLETVQLNENNDWKHRFTNLVGAYDDYEIKEMTELSGFKLPVITGKGTAKVTIENRQIELTELTITKTWHDGGYEERPSSINVRLHRHIEGQEPSFLRTVTISGETWKTQVEDLLKTDAQGRPYIYTIEEIVPEGYRSKVDGLNLTNTLLTTVSGTKTWMNTAEDKKFPVRVELLQNGQAMGENYSRVLEEGAWDYRFEDVPAYDSQGEKIEYSLKETALNGGNLDDFIVRIIPEESLTPRSTLLNISNAYDVIEIAGQKFWIGDDLTIRPKEITVILERSQRDQEKWSEVDRKTVTDKDWTYDFGKQKQYEVVNGNLVEYEYQLKEILPDNVKDLYTSKPKKNFNLLNTYNGIDIVVGKQWNAPENQQVPIKLNLLRNGEIVDNAELSAPDWSHVFKYLPGRHEEYRVQEVGQLSGFEEAVVTGQDGVFMVTNTLTPDAHIKGSKIWTILNGAETQDITVALVIRDKESHEILREVKETVVSAPDWNFDFDISYEPALEEGQEYWVTEKTDLGSDFNAPVVTQASEDVFLIENTTDLPRFSLDLKKTSSANATELSGAVMQLSGPGLGAEGIFEITDEQGNIDFGQELLAPNHPEAINVYTVLEREAPQGHQNSFKIWKIEIAFGGDVRVFEDDTEITDLVFDGQRISLQIENEFQPKEVVFEKLSASTGVALEGASFELRNEAGDLVETLTDENPSFNQLLLGRYSLQEKEAPEGYVLDTTIYTFEIDPYGNFVDIEQERPQESGLYVDPQGRLVLLNYNKRQIRLEVLKMDADFDHPDHLDFGAPMEGVEFLLVPVELNRSILEDTPLFSDEQGVLRRQEADNLLKADIELAYGSTQSLTMTRQPIKGFYMHDSVYTVTVPEDGSDPRVSVTNASGEQQELQIGTDFTFEDGLIRFLIYSSLELDFILHKIDGDNPEDKLDASFMLSELVGADFSTLTSFSNAERIDNNFQPIEQLATVDGVLDLSRMIEETPNLKRGVVYQLKEVEAPRGFLLPEDSLLIYKDIDQKIYVRLAREAENNQLDIVDFARVYQDFIQVDEENAHVHLQFPNYREKEIEDPREPERGRPGQEKPEQDGEKKQVTLPSLNDFNNLLVVIFGFIFSFLAIKIYRKNKRR